MERRGEIRPLWKEARVSRAGLAIVPYVRLKSRAQLRKERLLRSAGWSVVGLSGGVAFLVALWEARVMIGGGALFAGSAWFLITRRKHSGACAGLHCPGCKHHS